MAALILVEECRLRLDDPVDELLPELADRTRAASTAADRSTATTVPAHRPITLHDVLTFRLGCGMDFAAPWPQPLLEAMGELGLGAGPPEPQVPPAARRVDATALDAAAAVPTRRALALQRRAPTCSAC